MRIAIIGVQHGHVLGITRQILAEDDAELVAVAEPEHETCERVAREFGVPGVSDYRSLLDGSIDAAVLAPVNAEKGHIAVACLASGVHVMIDKPAATTHTDLDRMSGAISGSAVLSCALTLRFSGPYRAAKQAIERGDIGRVVSSVSQRPHKCGPGRRPSWFFDRNLNGGALLDLCIHDIDMVRWLHGCEPTSVTASEGTARFTEYPSFTDHAEAYFRLDDGGSAFVRASWLTPDAAPYHGDCRMLIEGTHGAIEIRTSAEASCTIDTGSARSTYTDFDYLDLGSNALGRDFISAIRGEPQTVISGNDVIKSHRWALLARDSADYGNLVEAPLGQ